MATKPMDLFVAERALNMGRCRPGPAKRQLPLMDHPAPHVEERGPRTLGRRDECESVVGLARPVYGQPLPRLNFRRVEGSHRRFSALVPGLATRERLMQELGRRELEKHHGRPAYVRETGEAEN